MTLFDHRNAQQIYASTLACTSAFSIPLRRPNIINPKHLFSFWRSVFIHTSYFYNQQNSVTNAGKLYATDVMAFPCYACKFCQHYEFDLGLIVMRSCGWRYHSNHHSTCICIALARITMKPSVKIRDHLLLQTQLRFVCIVLLRDAFCLLFLLTNVLKNTAEHISNVWIYNNGVNINTQYCRFFYCYLMCLCILTGNYLLADDRLIWH